MEVWCCSENGNGWQSPASHPAGGFAPRGRAGAGYIALWCDVDATRDPLGRVLFLELCYCRDRRLVWGIQQWRSESKETSQRKWLLRGDKGLWNPGITGYLWLARQFLCTQSPANGQIPSQLRILHGECWTVPQTWSKVASSISEGPYSLQSCHRTDLQK